MCVLSKILHIIEFNECFVYRINNSQKHIIFFVAVYFGVVLETIVIK